MIAKEFLWLTLFMILGAGLVSQKAIAQSPKTNGFISPEVEQAIRERVCFMRQQGYTEGEIKEQARYIARANQKQLAPSRTFVDDFMGDITDVFADGIVVLTKCPT